MNSFETSVWPEVQQQLKGFVLKHTKDKALADDIMQDVFLKVHDKYSQLRESDKIFGWIFRIARNTITDHFRSASRTINTTDIDWDSEAPSFNDCVSTCLQEMILTLPDKYREAIELAELKNMSQTQLALEIHLSYSGAKSRVQRARQLLRQKMEESYRLKFDKYGNAIVCENRPSCGCS